jgi:hypothetical protein
LFFSAKSIAARVRAFAEFLHEQWEPEEFSEPETRAPGRKRRARRSGASSD